ncbi:MAG: DMT family transporter [Terrisporobacter sp.]|uniref:DMT family transporter n=1 Tax=Terrisporobacter sp. TaxID=1965305 RepID=UPI002FCC1FCE
MGYLYIGLAGMFWSTIGLFTTNLAKAGLSTEEISFLRLSVGCLILVMYAIIKNPGLLKISKKGLFYSIIIGLLCQGMFNYCYVNAIKSSGSAVAAVLLYTSPIFITVFSKVIYKEKINKMKLISLSTCVVAAILAVTGGSLDLQSISSTGIIFGIMAAVLYSLMPIISKNILDEVNNLTMMIYSFLTGALMLISRVDFTRVSGSITDLNVLPNIIGFGLFSGALAYICYTSGVKSGIELSIAGVIASIELVFAQIIGWTIMGEPFNFVKVIGVMLMMVSAVVAIKSAKTATVENAEDDFEIGKVVEA